MKGGGTCICTRKEVGSHEIINSSETLEYVHVVLEGNLNVVCVYKRPQKPFEEFISIFENVIKS